MTVETIDDIVLGAVADLLSFGEEPGAPSRSLLAGLSQAAARLPGVAGAGVMWSIDERLRHAHGTDEVISDLQRLQETGQAGPSVQAFRTAVAVDVSDLAAAVRWPLVAGKAGRVQAAAYVAVPVSGRAGPVGALAIWGGSRSGWSRDHTAALALLSDVVVTRLVHEEEYEHLARTGGDLRHALRSRVLIEQAKGVLAGRKGVSVEQALTILRRHARNRGLTLHSVAGAVVSGRLRI